jgi:hypothetical protein
VGWPTGVGQLGLASWGWLQLPFFIVCLNQGHFFSKFFLSISTISFLQIFFFKISWGERKSGVASWGWPVGGGQLGVASWGWLQSPFFIVCLNQGHCFISLSSSISMIFFKLFLQNIIGERGGEWEKGYIRT